MIKARTLKLLGRTLEDGRSSVLSHGAFRLLVHLTCEFDGTNNTAIPFTYRDGGAGCGIGRRASFANALNELLQYGLIQCQGTAGEDAARYTLTMIRPVRRYSTRKSALRHVRALGNA
jgi:hypothetical protein